jgi:multidrug efflux pump subunit AcrB
MSNNWFHKMIAKVLEGRIPVLIILIALISGLLSLYLTPREEEPQIVVPMADVFISAPGLTANQVERQITTALEKLLAQIDGVEHVYSISRNGSAVVTVRFYVGEDREGSLVKIYNKIYSNTDKIPAAVSSWVVKPIEVDDVPIMLIALWSPAPERYGDHELRRLAEELSEKLKVIKNTNKIEITGGRPRQIRVELDPEAMAARRTAPLDVVWALGLSNERLPANTIQQQDYDIVIEAGDFIRNAQELKRLVVNVVDGVPVYLDEVATVIDGPAEPDSYTWIGFGPADKAFNQHTDYAPAVVISVAKQKGSNAVWVARDVEKYLQEFKQQILPAEIEYRLIRNYGETANEKVNDLTSSLLLAVIIVVVFISIFLGWRAALVVGLAIPVCYGAALGLDLLGGYTINRVTLFALILSLGLLVDDPITGVDNIERFLRNKDRDSGSNVKAAMFEIRNALVMSTIAIILAFIPLAFITGMMGPYMAPMAFNVPIAVTLSTVVAFFVTPWVAWKILKQSSISGTANIKETVLYKIYTRLITPLIAKRSYSWIFLGVVILLFLIASILPMYRLVPLKLLPYDNKNEFQVVVDMPEGTSLERTQAVTQQVADYLKTIPEVREVIGFAGLASPMDFNGLVRHYYLRKGNHVADIRVTLVDRLQRQHQSHEIVTRIRSSVNAIGDDYGANIKLVEVPPGPPVISTITVELYGEETTPYPALRDAATIVAKRLQQEPFVVDIDTSVEEPQKKLLFITDKDKAALSGIATKDIANTMKLAIQGTVAGFMEIPTEANPLPIILRLPLEKRSALAELSSLQVKGRAGFTRIREKTGVRDAPQPLIPLGELGVFNEQLADTAIYHKDLRRVSYVFAEMAGRPPVDAVLDITADLNSDQIESQPRPLDARSHINRGGGVSWSLPDEISAVWNGEGELQITLRVFRDMGLAFAAAMIGIFFVLFIQTNSASLTLIIMSAIPLTVIGIMPGFWLLNQIGERAIAGTPNLVLFTATAMIGMIALAGIVIRNSLILVEFIHLALARGLSLTESLAQAGAVRMRPVLLTAGTTMLGNIVITLDPIFSGLAWAIIFGIMASTVFTLLVIPVTYFLVYGKATSTNQLTGTTL